MKKLFLFFFVVCTTVVYAQVTTVPSIIHRGYTGEVTVVFNPNEGNGGMANATQCYAHTGVTYDGTSWQHANAKWRDGLDKYKMTKNADGNWELKITPNICEWYGAIKITSSVLPGPDGKPTIVRDTTYADVTQLCFVFNDGPGGELEGKAAGGADIFVDLVEPGLAVIFESEIPEIAQVNDKLTILGAATEAETLSLTINGTVVASVESAAQLAYEYTIPAEGDYTFVLTATKGEEVKTVSASTCVISAPTTAARPAGIDMGIYYDENDDTKVTLATYAASKTEAAKHVFVVGDFNDWTLSNQYQMKKDGNYFWLEINGLTPQKEYAFQYVVVRADGVVKKISDLFSEKVLHSDDQWEPIKVNPDLMPYPTKADGYATVIQTAKPEYQWSEATLNFKRPNKNNLVIYEVWVYDYTPERSINGLLNRLDYIQDLGVNAIELMPVTEFDGNENWGYSPNHYFALDKAYGTPEQLKHFVDECHKRGIAVILDMVFNHATGLNPMNKLYPYGTELAHNPWFNVNAPHSDNVYEDWNHDFAPTKTMFTRALQYWLTEYKVDGYRMDLSHGLCGTKNNAMTHIADYYNNGVKAVSEDAYFILEHWGANMGSDRPKLVSQGMMCWENSTNAYCQTTMGWLSEDAFNNANKDGYVSYCESHDEERMQYKAKMWGNGDLKTNVTARLNRVPVNVAFNVLLNGPHMLWQFEEIGYDFSINSSYDDPDGTSEGNRCAKKPRPEELGYFDDLVRMEQYTKVAQTIHLRTKLLPNVFEGNPTQANINGGRALRTVQWGKDVFIAGNFSVVENQTVTIPEGTWYNYFKQEQLTANSLTLAPGELLILTSTQVELPKVGLDATTGLDDIINNATQPVPPYNVYVYNINGQLMNQQVNAMSADLTGLNSGLYIVQYEKNGQRVAKKVIR
ncbi:MAG: T9SS type A sorting domain-containing protein [Paludibacteraceae bacterium]|nr:T9SS type A sorting domain-containing protein [Paludibacteraceae bacterium]